MNEARCYPYTEIAFCEKVVADLYTINVIYRRDFAMGCVINHNTFDKARTEKQRECDKRYKDAVTALTLRAIHALKISIRSLTNHGIGTKERQQEFLMKKMVILCREEMINGIFRTLGYTADVIVYSYTGFVPFTKLPPSQIVLHTMDPYSLREYAETLFIVCLLLPSERTLPYKLPCMVRECANAYRALNNQGASPAANLEIHRRITHILPIAKKMLRGIGYQF